MSKFLVGQYVMVDFNGKKVEGKIIEYHYSQEGYCYKIVRYNGELIRFIRENQIIKKIEKAVK